MKFKKGDRVECVKQCCDQFTKGKIYTVKYDLLDDARGLYLEEDDHGNENWHCAEFFKLIEENKMKTDNKTMIEVLQKVISNIENGVKPTEGIQVFINEWENKDYIDFLPNKFLYRIKPETITLKNGVTIPKPLDASEIKGRFNYYIPHSLDRLWDGVIKSYIDNYKPRYIYATKEDAITASKALFGIE